jgi:hypothetical protein
MMKKRSKIEKNSRHSPFLIVSEAAQNLSFFINFLSIFINFLSFSKETEENDKNYQQNDEKTIKIDKQMKKLETFTIFDCFRRGQNLSIFYQFFIDSFSPRKQRKMNKNFQKMMKNDKKMIKKMKKTRDTHHF